MVIALHNRVYCRNFILGPTLPAVFLACVEFHYFYETERARKWNENHVFTGADCYECGYQRGHIIDKTTINKLCVCAAAVVVALCRVFIFLLLSL